MTPVAVATATPDSGAAVLEVAFDGSASTGTIDTYAWDFGDETTAATPSPTHDYEVDGVYTVTLTVSGDDGEDATTLTVTVVSGSRVFYREAHS